MAAVMFTQSNKPDSMSIKSSEDNIVIHQRTNRDIEPMMLIEASKTLLKQYVQTSWPRSAVINADPSLSRLRTCNTPMLTKSLELKQWFSRYEKGLQRSKNA